MCRETMSKYGCRISRVKLKDSDLEIIYPPFSNHMFDSLLDGLGVVENANEDEQITGYVLITLQKDQDFFKYDTDLPETIFWDRIRGLIDPAGSEEASL